MVVDGAMTGELFEAYARRVLAPALAPGDSAVPDSLAAHKRAGARRAIEAAGAAAVFLPPHSPDLSPIEQAFAELKALLCKAGRQTADGLWGLLGQCLDAFGVESRGFNRAGSGVRGNSH
jgi:transposase